MVWFGWVLWHINHWSLFNTKSFIYIYIYIYIYIHMICFVLFYCISTIVDYLEPTPLSTYILKIYDLVGFGFIAYQLFVTLCGHSLCWVCVCVCVRARAGQRISLSALAQNPHKGPNGETSRKAGSGRGKKGPRKDRGSVDKGRRRDAVYNGEQKRPVGVR